MSLTQPTSLISILSCVHGRMRRVERDIDKRDLQAALKYGKRERTYKGRWKIEYDGIIFIVDKNLEKEITAFHAPMDEAPIDPIESMKHHKASTILGHKPELCKSHTVLVVDNSGSMQTHDITGHRDRQVAAYSAMALEFIAERLFNQTANDTDVVSLIEFNETASIVYLREPCSWVLYNMLLSRRESSNFVSRQVIKNREFERADSNYIPALEAAKCLLEVYRHDECALALYFLSDGEPSDARHRQWTPVRTTLVLQKFVADMAKSFGEHLTMRFVGFGNASDDFSTLRIMTEACNTAPGGAKAEFVYCGKTAHALGTSLTSLATSLTQTRTSLVGRGSSLGQKRTVALEKETGLTNTWRFFRILNHWIYSPQSRRLVRLPSEPPGALQDGKLDRQQTETAPPPFLAMNNSSCGYGAERIAFRCFLANSASTRSFTLGSTVAKETNLVNQLSENVAFHKAFCETQSLASFLADEFNKRIRAMSGYDARSTPIITFLPCSILVLHDNSVSGGLRGVLVEKMLDTTRFKWSKWNDNGGGVDGRAYHAPLDLEREYKLLSRPSTGLEGVIEEGSEDEDGAESESDDGHTPAHDTSRRFGTGATEVAPEAYLQAFSHFTQTYTNRKLLVCDLQGVYNTSTVPPRFELTDPAIHYRSNRGRRMVYGRTDKGAKGIRLFFKTHKCSDICKLANLGRRNKDWHQAWTKEYQQKYTDSESA